MKNIIIAAVLIASFVLPQSASAYYEVRKTNGGANGYNKVKEDGGEGWRRLNCSDPGQTACKFASSISIGGGSNLYDIERDIMPNVEGLIASGQLSGQYTLDENIVVSWNATDVENYSLYIED